MGERVTVSVKIDKEVAEDMRKFTIEKTGKKRGELGRMYERACIEYMDNDRYERIEAGQEETHEMLQSVLATLADTDSTHTHTADVSPTTVGEKRDLIAAKLNDRDAPVMPERDVIDAIDEVAGGDDRTVRKYKEKLRQSGEVMDHPSSDSTAWTTDAEQFASWALAEFESRPDASIREILEPYAMDPNEYEDLLDQAAASAEVRR